MTTTASFISKYLWNSWNEMWCKLSRKEYLGTMNNFHILFSSFDDRSEHGSRQILWWSNWGDPICQPLQRCTTWFKKEREEYDKEAIYVIVALQFQNFGALDKSRTFRKSTIANQCSWEQSLKEEAEHLT